MQKIPAAKAVEGMVLAKPVLRENGVVLMGEGTELSDLHVKKLLDLDVKAIVVKGHPLDTGAEEKPLEQLYAELDDRFSTVSGDKLSDQIKEFVRKSIKRRKEEEAL